jgi:hypothetical protein
MGDSWRLTAAAQWAIVRMLALIGGGLAVLLVGGALALGSGLAGFTQPVEALVRSDALAVLLRFGLGLPFALLTVIVPLGIYRQLSRADSSAEVFD